jgi:hypothetical protein
VVSDNSGEIQEAVELYEAFSNIVKAQTKEIVFGRQESHGMRSNPQRTPPLPEIPHVDARNPRSPASVHVMMELEGVRPA